MSYIFYHNNSSTTGKELKVALEIDGGSSDPGRQNKLIRWGNRGTIRYQAGAVLNKLEACNNAGNKQRALEIMNREHVSVPPMVNSFDGELLIGRTASHMQGKGAFLITSKRDFDLAKSHLECTHFMRYIPTEREYRVHVFRGQIIAQSEKRMSNNATSLHIRNFETGWVFHYLDGICPELKDIALRAVISLGLDFGAVDIIHSINGNFYVLEVNTAPSLVKEREDGSIDRMPAFDLYVKKFREWLNE